MASVTWSPWCFPMWPCVCFPEQPYVCSYACPWPAIAQKKIQHAQMNKLMLWRILNLGCGTVGPGWGFAAKWRVLRETVTQRWDMKGKRSEHRSIGRRGRRPVWQEGIKPGWEQWDMKWEGMVQEGHQSLWSHCEGLVFPLSIMGGSGKNGRFDLYLKSNVDCEEFLAEE
jgi:hypothetical protein